MTNAQRSRIIDSMGLAMLTVAGRCHGCGGKLVTPVVRLNAKLNEAPCVGEIEICAGCIHRLLTAGAISKAFGPAPEIEKELGVHFAIEGDDDGA